MFRLVKHSYNLPKVNCVICHQTDISIPANKYVHEPRAHKLPTPRMLLRVSPVICTFTPFRIPLLLSMASGAFHTAANTFSYLPSKLCSHFATLGPGSFIPFIVSKLFLFTFTDYIYLASCSSNPTCSKISLLSPKILCQ